MTYRQTRAHQAIIIAANSSRYGNDGVSDSMENNRKKPASRYRSLKMTSSRMSLLTGMVVGAYHRDPREYEIQNIYFIGLSNEQPRYTDKFSTLLEVRGGNTLEKTYRNNSGCPLKTPTLHMQSAH